MSRCFPFPPPGYVLKGIPDEAMIVSIKGAEEKAKKEQRRKERKTEKKKNKKDKKEKEKKRKEREGNENESQKHSHKRRCKEEGVKVDLIGKLKESKVNCLEKSSLTVEPELFQSSQNSCDSTLSSYEILPKQKEKQHFEGRHNNDSESIIRIRLPIRRQKDPEVMLTNKKQEKNCFSRGRKLDSSQLGTREPVTQLHCSTSAPEHAPKPHEEKSKDPIFGPKPTKKEISSSSTPEPYQTSSLCRCPPSMVMQLLNVVENWIPDAIDIISSEDEDWWWSTKKQSSPIEKCKQLNKNNEIKQVSNSTGWPCARLLQEAEVYALPYAVPF